VRRRHFIQRLPVVGSGLLMGASTVSLVGCGGVTYLVPTTAPGRLTIGAGQLAPEGDAFLQSPGMSRPVYLRRLSSGDIVALLASCTHQGCQPSPVGDRLVCPCHGSEFSMDGGVLQGPAEEPLQRYAVTEDGGTVTVWLDQSVPR
jgi:Rieske Fe-S protein